MSGSYSSAPYRGIRDRDQRRANEAFAPSRLCCAFASLLTKKIATPRGMIYVSETRIARYLFTAVGLRQTVHLDTTEAVMVIPTRVALVTGSTDGVGRYVAAKLAEAGMKVLVHGRDRARAETVVRKAVTYTHLTLP